MGAGLELRSSAITLCIVCLFVWLVLFVVFLRKGSCVWSWLSRPHSIDQADLKLRPPASACLLSARIRGLCHHLVLFLYLKQCSSYFILSTKVCEDAIFIPKPTVGHRGDLQRLAKRLTCSGANLKIHTFIV